MIKSVLAAECGSTTTTAVLIEQVDDHYRLRATGQTPSTHGPPWLDITIGVQQAIRHIEKVVGRTLLTSGGWPITPQSHAQQGVDAFTIVCSAGQPLQVVVAGLMRDVSLASAQHAAATTYTHITKLISLEATDGGRYAPESRVKAIEEGKPDVILLVGGTDGGAEQPVIEMAELISIGLRVLQDGAPPAVLFAGNQELRTVMADILGPVAALNSVNNVRPRLDVEDLLAAQEELEKLYIEKKMPQLPGFDKLRNWSKYPITPVSKSFTDLITYIGQHSNLNVAGVDIGSRSTSVVQYKREDRPKSTIRGDVGVGHSLLSLIEAVPIQRIHRWLPFEISIEELRNRLLNKSLYPATVPSSYEDLMIEHAVAREALRLVLKQADNHSFETQWSLIIGAGRTVTGSPQAMQAALLLIDGLEPWGVTSLALDRNGLVSMLGSIAAVEPTAAVNVAMKDAFLNLGTVVAPMGHGRADKPAVKIKVEFKNEEVYETEVAYNSLEVIGLPPGEKATLEIRPTRHFDIGLGQPGRGAITEVEGGLLGIIIDARGRPLRFPKDESQRQEQVQQWLASVELDDATPDYDR